MDEASGLTLREFERIVAGEFRAQGSDFDGWVEEIEGMERKPLPDRIQMEAQPEGPVSFYVEASSLVASLEGTAAAIEVPPGACLDFLLASDDDAGHGARPDALCPGTWPAVLARPAAGASLRFKLEGQNVSRAQWHNMDTDCPGETECPSGGSQQTDTVQFSSTDYIRTRRHVFEDATGTASAGATGRGEAKFVLLGGTSIDLAVNGWVRLPLASGDTGCASCLAPSNQTFFATGNLTLANLQMSPGRGLHAEYSGTLQTVRFDEQDLDPSLITGPAALVAVATATGAAILVKLLSPLFTRHKEDNPLDNARRRRLYDYVVQNPGVHFREVMRAAGIPSGSGRHHVTQLVRAGLLVEHRIHSKVRLFENNQRLAKSWKGLAALRDPILRELHKWVAQNPGSSQKDILTAFHASGWNPSTTKSRLERLVRQGMLTFHLHGRYKLYSASVPN